MKKKKDSRRKGRWVKKIRRRQQAAASEFRRGREQGKGQNVIDLGLGYVIATEIKT